MSLELYTDASIYWLGIILWIIQNFFNMNMLYKQEVKIIK